MHFRCKKVRGSDAQITFRQRLVKVELWLTFISGGLSQPGSLNNGRFSATWSDRVEASAAQIRGVRGDSGLALFLFPREGSSVSVREGKWTRDSWMIRFGSVEWKLIYSARPIDFSRTRLTVFAEHGEGEVTEFMPRRRDIRTALSASGWA